MQKIGNTETDLAVDDSVACRNIVREIMDFGVNEQQILKLIYLLSLELSNRDALIEISNAAKGFINNVADAGKNQSKIIT